MEQGFANLAHAGLEAGAQQGGALLVVRGRGLLRGARLVKGALPVARPHRAAFAAAARPLDLRGTWHTITSQPQGRPQDDLFAPCSTESTPSVDPAWQLPDCNA